LIVAGRLLQLVDLAGIDLLMSGRYGIQVGADMDKDRDAVGGRVIRVTNEALESDQWFIVGLDDDDSAVELISRAFTAGTRIEIMARLTSEITARWNLRQGEIIPPANSLPAFA
jgi:hypothetical protein